MYVSSVVKLMTIFYIEGKFQLNNKSKEPKLLPCSTSDIID